MANLTKKQKSVQIDAEKLHGIDEAITLALSLIHISEPTRPY